MSVSTFSVVIAEVTSIICGTTVFPQVLREAFGKYYENYAKSVCRYLGKNKNTKNFLFMY